MSENRREYFRINYPLDEQPSLFVGVARYRVRECSERGLSFMSRGGEGFTEGGEIAGIMEFASGQRAEVAGRIVRVFDDVVAVELSQRNVPFGIILSEQRRLHAQGRLA
jgi:hypothetical protein